MNFDNFSSNYRALISESTGTSIASIEYFSNQKVWHLKKELTKISIEPQNILDYGCGIGLALPFLRKYFPNSQITGSDISTKSLAIAAKEHDQKNINFQSVDEIMEKKFSATFDLINISCVMHHIPTIEERKSVADNLYKKCRNRGSIALFEHNPLNPVTQQMVSSCPFDADAVLLRANEAVNLLEKSGFKIISKKYISFIPPVFKGIRKAERFLSWCPLGAQYFVLAQKLDHCNESF